MGGDRVKQREWRSMLLWVCTHETHSMDQNQACYSQGERGRGVGGGWASSPPPSPAHCGPKPVNPAQGTGRVQLDFSPAHKPYQKLHMNFPTSLTNARIELVQYQKPAKTKAFLSRSKLLNTGFKLLITHKGHLRNEPQAISFKSCTAQGVVACSCI